MMPRLASSSDQERREIPGVHRLRSGSADTQATNEFARKWNASLFIGLILVPRVFTCFPPIISGEVASAAGAFAIGR